MVSINRESYEIVDINELPQRKMGFNLILNAVYEYKLSEIWSITFRPVFEVQLTSDYNSSYILFKNRLNYGGVLGLQFYI